MGSSGRLHRNGSQGHVKCAGIMRQAETPTEATGAHLVDGGRALFKETHSRQCHR